MENQAVTEKIFYQDGGVRVTQSRYITNSKTYAMRNISSVHVFEIVKSRTFPVLLIIIGILMLLSDDVRISGLVILAIGVLVLLLLKNEFAVRISTNAGEVNSIISKDRAYIEHIVNALNDAIIHIG